MRWRALYSINAILPMVSVDTSSLLVAIFVLKSTWNEKWAFCWL